MKKRDNIKPQIKIWGIIPHNLLWGFLLILLFSATIAHAWKITPELKKELEEKKSAVEKNPNSPHAHFDLAITYGYCNKLQEGFKELAKVNEIDPKYRPKALDTYFYKVTKNPGDWKLRFRLAFAYYFNDKKDEAIREFENVIKIDPYNVWAYGYMALIYGEKKDYDKAIKITKQALAIDNYVAALHLLLSEGYSKKGNHFGSFLEKLQALKLLAQGY